MNDTSLRLPQCQQLLTIAASLSRYEKELQQATGENFNLFEVLHVGDYEVRTHSPILAELLNPLGRHGQGGCFLELFFNLITAGLKDVTSQQLPKASCCSVTMEHHLGELGRADIFISGPGCTVIIENKIHAADQKDQISRYLKYGTNPLVIYLTLDGRLPQEFLHKENEQDLQDLPSSLLCFSYKSHIINWLTDCRSKVPTIPQVRESLTQYIHLIQRLTNQNTNARMNKDLVNAILNNSESYAAYNQLCKANWAVKSEIIRELNDKIASAVPAGFTLSEKLTSQGEAGERFLYRSPIMDAHNLCFSLQFDNAYYQNCFFGFGILDLNLKQNLNPTILPQLLDVFNHEFGIAKTTQIWPAWNWCPDSFRNWNDDVFHQIKFSDLREQIITLINRIAKVANQVFSATESLTLKS